MKKLLMVLTITLISSVSFGQEFMGIKVGGKLNEVVEKLKQKGFKIIPNESIAPNIVRMEGLAGRNYVDMTILSSPISKTVWKFAVYLPEQDNWFDIKWQYNEYLNLLTKKYGEPDKKYEFFFSPYFDGDGYEMTAITMDKCFYKAYWSDKIGVYMKISKFKQVVINYENTINSEIDTKENSQLNSKVF
jgi:hypothetical protein